MSARTPGRIRYRRETGWSLHPAGRADARAVREWSDAPDSGGHGWNPGSPPHRFAPASAHARADRVIWSERELVGAVALERGQWHGDWPLQPWGLLGEASEGRRFEADPVEGQTLVARWLAWRARDWDGAVPRRLARLGVIEVARRLGCERAVHALRIHPDLGPGAHASPEAYLQQLDHGGLEHPHIEPMLQSGFQIGGYRRDGGEPASAFVAVLVWEEGA